MKAIVVEDGVVRVGDLDVPEPTAGQALVRITTAGVCHSDLHLAKGDWMGVSTPQLGHEAIGVVEAPGPTWPWASASSSASVVPAVPSGAAPVSTASAAGRGTAPRPAR